MNRSKNWKRQNKKNRLKFVKMFLGAREMKAKAGICQILLLIPMDEEMRIGYEDAPMQIGG